MTFISTILVIVAVPTAIAVLLISFIKNMRIRHAAIDQVLRRPRFCTKCGSKLTYDLLCARCLRYFAAEAIPLSGLALMIPASHVSLILPPLSLLQSVLLMILFVWVLFNGVTATLAVAVYLIYLTIRAIARRLDRFKCPLCKCPVKPDAYFCPACGVHLFDKETAAEKLEREITGLILAHTYYCGPNETVALVQSLIPAKSKARTHRHRPRRT
jgi:hypothetical protein